MEYKDKKEWLYKNKTRLRRNIGKVIKRNNSDIDVEILKVMIEMIDVIDLGRGGKKWNAGGHTQKNGYW